MRRTLSLALLLSALPLWAAAPPAPEPAHWSFRSPVRHSPPAVRNAGWCRNPIDGFVLARLEKAGLKPAAQADRVALIRRLTIDLTGLPPPPEDVDAFVS